MGRGHSREEEQWHRVTRDLLARVASDPQLRRDAPKTHQTAFVVGHLRKCATDVTSSASAVEEARLNSAILRLQTEDVAVVQTEEGAVELTHLNSAIPRLHPSKLPLGLVLLTPTLYRCVAALIGSIPRVSRYCSDYGALSLEHLAPSPTTTRDIPSSLGSAAFVICGTGPAAAPVADADTGVTGPGIVFRHVIFGQVVGGLVPGPFSLFSRPGASVGTNSLS